MIIVQSFNQSCNGDILALFREKDIIGFLQVGTLAIGVLFILHQALMSTLEITWLEI
jgi:hypothetical protein